MKKILIQTFSSGIDSTTTIYKAIKKDNFDLVIPINFTYGQKNVIETTNQKHLIEMIQSELNTPKEINSILKRTKVLNVNNINIEKMFDDGMNLYGELRDSNIIKEKTGTEYYTPMRNLLFSTIGAMLGELAALGMNEECEVYVGIGVHKHSNIYKKDYWDITPEFVNRLNSLFQLNDTMPLKLYAPYANNTKAELVSDSIRLGVPYLNTWTCYNPSIKDASAVPCLECEACREREKAFLANNIYNGNAYSCYIEDGDKDEESDDKLDNIDVYPNNNTIVDDINNTIVDDINIDDIYNKVRLNIWVQKAENLTTVYSIFNENNTVSISFDFAELEFNGYINKDLIDASSDLQQVIVKINTKLAELNNNYYVELDIEDYKEIFQNGSKTFLEKEELNWIVHPTKNQTVCCKTKDDIYHFSISFNFEIMKFECNITKKDNFNFYNSSNKNLAYLLEDLEDFISWEDIWEDSELVLNLEKEDFIDLVS